MTVKTHFAGGMAAAALLCNDIPSAILLMVGSLLPDIDHGGSTISKNIPLIHKIFTHRGFTHSLLFIYIIGTLISPWLGMGILVHILLDMFTSQGVHLFSPFTWRMGFYPLAYFIKTGGSFETFVRWVCYGLAILFICNTLCGDFLYLTDFKETINIILN